MNQRHTSLLNQVVDALITHDIEAKVVSAGGSAEPQLRFPYLGQYKVVFRSHISPSAVGPLLAQIREIKGQVLLLAEYIAPTAADALRASQLQFVDASGNAYMFRGKPRIYIWIQGRKPAVPPRRTRPSTAFRASGLKIIFPLICLGDVALQAPYRQIAEWADVSLGSVSNTIEDLENLGYIRKTKKGVIIEDRETLIRRWCEHYPTELRPQLNQRRYSPQNIDRWQKLNQHVEKNDDIYLSGESAAAILTKYIHPETVTVYGRPNLKRLVSKLGNIAKDESGALEIIDRFWNFDVQLIKKGYKICPLPLVYADLLATGEARQLDAASMLRNQYAI